MSLISPRKTGGEFSLVVQIAKGNLTQGSWVIKEDLVAFKSLPVNPIFVFSKVAKKLRESAT